MNNGMKDTALMLEKRTQKSQAVRIQFINPFDFNVLETGEGSTRVKYLGRISLDKQGDSCTCPSFVYGQQYAKSENGKPGESRYEAEHGHSFQCKHLIRSHNMNKLGLKEA